VTEWWVRLLLAQWLARPLVHESGTPSATRLAQSGLWLGLCWAQMSVLPTVQPMARLLALQTASLLALWAH